MRTVYAINLSVIPPAGHSAADAFETIRALIVDWVTVKYRKRSNQKVDLQFDGLEIVPRDGHSIRGQIRSAANASMLTLIWTEPHNSDSSLAWQSNVTMSRHGDNIEVAVVVRIIALRDVLRPFEFDLGRPRIVSTLLESFSTRVADWPVPDCKREISPPDIPQYVENVLLSSARALPVIVVSPDATSGKFLVDSSELMERVRGFAHVLHLSTKWAAFKLTDEVGKALSCFNGAVRVYWPGFSREANPYAHRLYLPREIERSNYDLPPFGTRLFRLLAAISTSRFAEGPVTRAVWRELDGARRAELVGLQAEVDKRRLNVDELSEQLCNALETIDTLSVENEELRESLDAQRAAWADVSTYSPDSTGEVSVAGPAQETLEARPRTVGEAVARAQSECSERLLFLESAVKSAEDSPFKNAERVYELLHAMNLIAEEWSLNEGRLGKSWVQAFDELGFEYKDRISQTTRGKWVNEYQFVYEGEKRLFENHVTLGSGQPDTCLSVHWYRDEEKRLLVIGHCGRHLTNTNT